MTDHSLTPHGPRSALRPRVLGDLVELVPYLLGFHPHGSLVLVALHGPRRRVGVTVRVDLAGALETPDLATSLGAYLRREQVREVLAMVFGGAGGLDGAEPSTVTGAGPPHRALVHALSGGLRAVGVTLVDALHVDGRRWRSYECSDPACCPPGGTALPAGEGRTSAAVAAATYAGLVALPDRAALERSLDPADQVSAEQMRVARETLTAEVEAARRGSGLDAWRAAAVAEIAGVGAGYARDGAVPLPGEKVARLLVLLADVGVRDGCCDWIGGEHGCAAQDLWRHLARRALPPDAVTPLALVAWTAWHAGAGPLARIAVERALAGDPDCRLALLLEEVLDRGIDPGSARRGRGHRGSSAPTGHDAGRPAQRRVNHVFRQWADPGAAMRNDEGHDRR